MQCFLKKNAENVWCSGKDDYLCIAIPKRVACLLGYGVMVTLQILVLSFLVRVRVSQQEQSIDHEVDAFFVSLRFFIRFQPMDGRRPSSRADLPSVTVSPIQRRRTRGCACIVGTAPWSFCMCFARVLEFGRLRSTGEGYDVADVLHTGDEQDEALETETESGVGA